MICHGMPTPGKDISISQILNMFERRKAVQFGAKQINKPTEVDMSGACIVLTTNYLRGGGFQVEDIEAMEDRWGAFCCGFVCGVLFCLFVFGFWILFIGSRCWICGRFGIFGN